MEPTAKDMLMLEQIIDERNEHLERDEVTGAVEICTYRNYVKGRHKLVLTETQKLVLKELYGNRFCDNLSHDVVDEARNRVKFLRWECQEQKVKEWLDDWYKLVRLGDRQSEITYDTFTDGNHGLGLAFSEKKNTVKISREKWWDGVSGLFIGYDDSDEMSYAVKQWKTKSPNGTEIQRMTVYFDDKFQRYYSQTGSDWKPYEEIDQPWESAWVNPRTKEPLHIPYIHLLNSGRSELNYGNSELTGGFIGVQDHINDLQWSMSGAGRFTAFQIIWAAGIKSVIDEATQKPIPNVVGPARMLLSSDPNTKFGHIPAGDLSQLIDLYWVKVKTGCRMTKTPLHLITGDWPSGEAILRAEEPAKGKAENQIKKFEQAYTLLAHRAIELHNAFSKEDKLEEDIKKAMVQAVFDDPTRRDKLSVSVIVNNLGERLSDQNALRMMGWDEDRIKTNEEEKSQKQKDSLEAMSSSFSRGQAPGTELPGTGPKSGEEPPSPNPSNQKKQE